MARLTELASRKPKSRSKRVTREGPKRKTPADRSHDKSPVHEHDVSLPELEIPNKPEVQKKPEAPKLKGVVFKEPAPQTKTLPAPVEGKGKGKLVEPPFPTNKQKLTPVVEQGLVTPDPKVITRREVDTREHLSLSDSAGATGKAMAVDLMTRVARSLSTVDTKLWE